MRVNYIETRKKLDGSVRVIAQGQLWLAYTANPATKGDTAVSGDMSWEQRRSAKLSIHNINANL